MKRLTFTTDNLAILRSFYIRAVSRGMDLQALTPMLHLIIRLTDEENATALSELNYATQNGGVTG